jgi:hypothetical protein
MHLGCNDNSRGRGFFLRLRNFKESGKTLRKNLEKTYRKEEKKIKRKKLLCIVVGIYTGEAAYSHKTPATAGVFYFFNDPKQPTNQPSIPGTIEHSNY